jgi:hypothetical protein
MNHKPTQATMFPTGQDLPLFSGTAQTGTINAFDPQPSAAKQMAFEIGDEITVKCFGITLKMVAIGRGKYPYDCISKDKHPDSMIFRGVDGSGWEPSHALQDTGLGYFIIV